MTTVYDIEVPDDLDIDYIKIMARKAVQLFDGCSSVRIQLEPNDGTRYPIIITDLGRAPELRRSFDYGTGRFTDDIEVGYHHGFQVTLAASWGGSYQWIGEHWCHPDYATEKWTHPTAASRKWTGMILAVFLNAFREAMGIYDSFPPSLLATVRNTEVRSDD